MLKLKSLPKFLVLKAAAIEAIIKDNSGFIPDARQRDIIVNNVSPEPIVSKGFVSKAGQNNFSFFVKIVAPNFPWVTTIF